MLVWILGILSFSDGNLSSQPSHRNLQQVLEVKPGLVKFRNRSTGSKWGSKRIDSRLYVVGSHPLAPSPYENALFPPSPLYPNSVTIPLLHRFQHQRLAQASQ